MRLMSLLLNRTLNQNTNTKPKIFLTLVSLGLTGYVAYINTINLQYNRAQAYNGARIANQLSRLNNSNFIYKLNCELNKEKEEKVNG